MAEASVLDRPHSQNARVGLKVPGITPNVLIETMRGEGARPPKVGRADGLSSGSDPGWDCRELRVY
jgi:hypothetical protein